MASELRVDRIVPTSGVPSGGGGSIIQVVQSTKTDISSATAGFNWTDMGLSASITPKFDTSKILVMVEACIGSSIGYDMKTRLLRGSTPIHIGDTAGNRPRVSVSITQSYSTVGDYVADQAIINYLDSPATTSAVTYKIQCASYSTGVMYLNRNGEDSDTSEYDGRSASSILLMEISG